MIRLWYFVAEGFEPHAPGSQPVFFFFFSIFHNILRLKIIGKVNLFLLLVFLRKSGFNSYISCLLAFGI